ncbi:MAG: hypothetical protein JXB48_09725 [Candidatus Latescibacteria bacterium]|nr:hypothetical protein [Candidatus Latescibacterota bacterium]
MGLPLQKAKITTMKQTIALFLKEFKNMCPEICAIFVVQIGYFFVMFSIISFFRFSGHPQNMAQSSMERYILGLFDMSFYLYPALLVYSLYIEERTGTVYLAYFLPAGRSMYLQIKFLIAAAFMALSIAVVTVTAYIYLPPD